MTPPGRRHFDSLQALRGVACLLIVAYHLAGWEHELKLGPPVLGTARWWGFAGVDLFFVISGFIITATQGGRAGRPDQFPGYAARRAWRIYPPYWAALILALAVGWAGYGPNPDEPGWRANLWRWALLIPTERHVLPPAWSLPYELMFYAAFGATFLAPPRAGKWLAGGWAAAVVAAGAAGFRPGGLLDMALNWYVLEFLAGCLIGWAVPAGVRAYRRAAVVLGLAGAVVTAVVAWRYDVDDSAVLFRTVGYGLPAALIVYGVTATEAAGGARLPRWLQRVGDASYSIYLAHFPVGLALVITVPNPPGLWPHVGWLVGMAAGMVAAGFGLHYAIERPLLAVGKKRGHGSAPPLPSVGEGAGG